MYAAIADLRGEGVTTAMALDARLTALIDEATQWIDRVTGCFFEPRTLTITMDGRGTPSLEPFVPPITITSLSINDEAASLDPADLLVIGGPLKAYFEGARLTLRHGRTFPKGQGNVVAAGRWGLTEDDGTSEGRTPLAIRRACILLVIRDIGPLSDDSSFEARNRWRVLEEQTRDQRYTLDPLPAGSRQLTGDPEIDALLLPFVRPMPLGAV